MIDKVTQDRIDICCNTNLKASGISPLRVLRWLDNFENQDWDKALTLAENITYISEKEIYAQYNHLIYKLFNYVNEDDKIFLLPSKVQDIKTGLGKSSQLMTYYLTKVIENLPNNMKKKITFLANARNAVKYKKELKEKAILVIFDDYIGSGDQIKNFIKNTVFKLYANYYSEIKSKFILSLYVLDKGESNIDINLPEWKIISQSRKKAFSRRGSVFGYEKLMIPIREFAYKYGKQFYINEKDKNGSYKKISIALGYNNSQEILSFCYRTPNNTLPIIWISAENWYPLFPRFANDIISEAKKFRKESAFLLFKAKHFLEANYSLISGICEKDEIVSKYITQNDILLLCVMRLKNHGGSVASICQKLDIRAFDYEQIISDGIKRGLLDSDESFSEVGKEAYDKILALNDKYDYELFWRDNFEDPNEILYLPKIFNRRA